MAVPTYRAQPCTAVQEGQVDDGRPSRLERAVDRVPFLEKELFLLRRLVTPGAVCLDVGAAGGAHLLAMARGVGPEGRVVGFEPRPGSLAALRRLVRLTGVGDRVTLVPAALSDGPGQLPLRIPIVPTRAHLPGTTRALDGAAAFARLPAREITVATRSLDEVVATEGLERVDVLKIDVEGAELAVLSGARGTLSEHRPVVLVEADDLHQARFDATAQDVVDEVVASGYAAHRYRRGRLERCQGDRVVAGEDDYVLLPVERPVPRQVA